MPRLAPTLLSLCLLGTALPACAGGLQVVWPAGWEVSEMPAPHSPFEDGVTGERQRAVKLQADGSQALVLELTRMPLAAGAEVNLENLLTEMRKGLQLGFAKSGLLASCSKPQATTLGHIAAHEVGCTISQQGNPALKQTLLAARGNATIYSLTYAMPVERESEVAGEVQALRDSLDFD
jgi:hypothetical protein